ncbi:MAG: DivIVA domain-containing protein [Clostridiales bacterium]|nr:DivIVA domain-containing protein [Clostridiales bacterium]
MLTPQEVSQRAFSKASFGGYNMAQVDEFLDVLTVDYATLYKENTVLKSKMKVLVEKVEEYRVTEDAMRMTLLSAQKMAESIVAEAEETRDSLLKNAEADARARTAGIQREIANEELRLTAAQNATAAYVAKLKELCRHEVDFLERLGDLVVTPPPEDPVEAAAEEIEDSMKRLLPGGDMPDIDLAEAPSPDLEDTQDLSLPRDGAPLREEAPVSSASGLSFELIDLTGSAESEPDVQPTVRINFDDLQFGRDYELK